MDQLRPLCIEPVQMMSSSKVVLLFIFACCHCSTFLKDEYGQLKNFYHAFRCLFLNKAQPQCWPINFWAFQSPLQFNPSVKSHFSWDKCLRLILINAALLAYDLSFPLQFVPLCCCFWTCTYVVFLFVCFLLCLFTKARSKRLN